MDKNKIKVVKKGDVRVVRPKRKKIASSRAAAREMVATVTDWVTDLKDRKGVETKAAIELLFGGNHRPSES
jgi:hypothetical protein